MTTPTLTEMFGRLLRAEGQSRAAVSVEYFGWLDMVLGLIMFFAPDSSASLLGLPAGVQTWNLLRLVGLLVSGLGLLYVASGRLNSQEFAFTSLLDRPIVPLVMAVLYARDILPGPLALAFSISDFGGFLWTLASWRQDARDGPLPSRPSRIARLAATFFSFTSGVVRNARTFHPDGRVFLGTVRSLDPANESLARAARQLEGTVLLRIGMGLMKKGMPRWLADHIPDAPSIAARFFTPASPDDTRLERHAGEDLDLLSTAGGDRLWKLVLNLATGGFGYGLHQFDYFRNVYTADVPYRIGDGSLDVWVRLVPSLDPAQPAASPQDGRVREQALTHAVARHATIRIEAQRTGHRREPFVPIAEIRFEEEIQIDQEALHFAPVTGRGFAPHGFLTDVRKTVYPSSVHSRAANAVSRARREHESLGRRLARYFSHRPIVVIEGETPAMRPPTGQTEAGSSGRSSGGITKPVLLCVSAVLVGYLAVRFTRDRPVDYADDLLHFKHGSTGGERRTGIPYWLFIALPDLFPEYLPDKTPGRGYSSLGMIYENQDDPRFALPVGMSMRNVRGLDMVYLNCAVCHTGTVRDAPGTTPRVVAGMPANTFDLGAFSTFLTSIPLDQKFTPDRLLDQIRVMQDDPHRTADKLDVINNLIYRYAAVYLARERLLTLGQRLAFIDKKSWGPGRVDTFNAPKALLNFPMEHADPRELMGNVDFPSIWYQNPRKGMQLHWDGNNTSVDERNLSAAFGTGAYPPSLDTERVLRTARWLETAAPPKYPYAIDGLLAARGAPLYAQYCGNCHGTRDPPFRHDPPLANELVGTVVPIEKIGTDRSRLDSYTWLLAVNQSTLYAGYEKDWGFAPPYPQRFTHFRKTQGYSNSPLDGIWLRGPYLHNGSVPNLKELLDPAPVRTKVFYRGNDVYDPQNVGFVSNLPALEGRSFFKIDTEKPGNGNAGHDGAVYGTDLPADQKQALLEYLKTF
ncbi:MAG: hypothetical protein ABJA98_31225 [Acidobacteriota bacterium]